MRRLGLLWALLGLLMGFAMACAGGASPTPTSSPTATQTPLSPPTLAPKKVVFMAGYRPQANLPFVAVYVAQEKGFFAQQGLEVDIRHASSGEHLKLLLAREVDITTASAGSVLERRSDPGLPIRAVVLWGQRGQQAFAVLESSGIRSVKDWEGKTFGYKTSVPPEYLALLEAEGVDRSRIREVRVGFDPRVLVEKKVDILAVFKSNEPDTLRRLGHPVRVFDPADYGIPTLGLTYIVHEDLIREDPDLIRRFLKATLKATYWAREHPDEAVEIVLKYAPREDPEHQRFMLEEELRDAQSDLTERYGIGWMTEEQWREFYDMLERYGALPKPFDYRTAYDDRFLREVYRDGQLLWP